MMKNHASLYKQESFLLLHSFHTFVCRNNRFDGVVFIELHLVNTYFAVYARLVVDIVFVDAVVNHVPLVFAGDLQNGVVCRSVNLQYRIKSRGLVFCG